MSAPVASVAPERRRYDSPLRRQQAAETKERIVAAGSELVHTFPSWDWRELTFRAVAQTAGVGLRTVYRYFPTERLLRDAVMQRLEEEAGVTYEGVTLASAASVAARVFASLQSFAVGPAVAGREDPTFEAEDDRRRQALRVAVGEAAPEWSDAQTEATAAALDVLWAVGSYERLVAVWNLDHRQATCVVSWVIGLVADAVDRDAPPPVRTRRARTGTR
jgi:AcrR family transcriptional regulator